MEVTSEERQYQITPGGCWKPCDKTKHLSDETEVALVDLKAKCHARCNTQKNTILPAHETKHMSRTLDNASREQRVSLLDRPTQTSTQSDVSSMR